MTLLCKIAKKHPYSVIYPLTMASRTTSPERLLVAEQILKEMNDHHPAIVADTCLVTEELIRISVLWR